MHQPGVVPLRPLRLGDVFGGALTIMRRNPKATVGMAALVTFGFMLVPIVFSLLVGATGEPLDLAATDPSGELGAEVVIGSVAGGLFSWLAGIVVTGLMVPVTEHALVGIKLSAGDAWRRSRSRLLPLLGFSVLSLVVAVAVLGLPVGGALAVGLGVGNTVATVLLVLLASLVAIALLLFVFVRFGLLAAPALVAEGRGVFSSIGRAGSLTSVGAWRLLGIYVLASLAAGMVGQVLAFPLGLVGGIAAALLPGGWGPAVLLLSSNLASIVTGAVVGPFTGGVVTLLYYDQRFRREGLDIELLQQVQSGGRR